jgi:hypothetical protein
MMAVLALCYALALQAMLAPQAALAAMARDAAGHLLCDTPVTPDPAAHDGQNACCLPGCAASCASRTAAKDLPPPLLPLCPGIGPAALRTAIVLPSVLPAATGEPSVAARPPQAHPRAPPGA